MLAAPAPTLDRPDRCPVCNRHGVKLQRRGQKSRLVCTNCGHHHDDLTVEVLLAEHGFHPVETGGGCRAYELTENEDGAHVMLTEHESPTAPENLHDPIMVGFYADQYSEPMMMQTFPSVVAFLATLPVED